MKKFLASLGASVLVAVGLFVGMGSQTALAGNTNCQIFPNCYSEGRSVETEDATRFRMTETVPILLLGNAVHVNTTLWVGAGGHSLEMGACASSQAFCYGGTFVYVVIDGTNTVFEQYLGAGGQTNGVHEFLIEAVGNGNWAFYDCPSGHPCVLDYTYNAGVNSVHPSAAQVGAEMVAGPGGIDNTSQIGSFSQVTQVYYTGAWHNLRASSMQTFVDNSCFTGSWNTSTSTFNGSKPPVNC